jgi:hypothetical protein
MPSLLIGTDILQIVQAHGDYLWVVKANQEGLYDEIRTLFEPVVTRPGWSAPPMDFRTAQTVEKGHGRLEKRRITVSSLLADYSQWPQAAQVFKLESQRTDAASADPAGGALRHHQFAGRTG